MKNLFKSKKGFTLVEIVIVIAIIGLLMIILIPSAINAFKNNRLQGAKIKAQRVASSLEAGIGSGKVPLTEANAKNLGIDTATETLVTTGTKAAPLNIEDVAGIKNLYNLPTNNEDLLDPLGDADEANKKKNNFRVYWEAGSGSTATAPKGKVFILNSDDAAADASTGDVIYSNTGNDLANPVYNK